MATELILIQALNGIQYGILLFLMAAGLTLVFGIMGFINLAHGALYMLGAYFAAVIADRSGSFFLAISVTTIAMFALGAVLSKTGLDALNKRDHLDQVLATFGIILFCNELVRMIWGPSPMYMDVPENLAGSIDLLGTSYSSYRIAIIAVGLLVGAAIYLLIERTRLGMLIRAGASNRHMVSALGVNIGWLNTFIFALGAALAGIAGVMAGPILSIQPGMGDSVLISTLVVIVIGGIGSIRGAFLGALVVGVADTVGRVVLPLALSKLFVPEIATTLGPAMASLAVYLLMAVVLAVKPDGLFPVRNR